VLPNHSRISSAAARVALGGAILLTSFLWVAPAAATTFQNCDALKLVDPGLSFSWKRALGVIRAKR